MRLRPAVDRFGDPLVALALAIGAEHDLWAARSGAVVVSGGRGVLAVLLALQTLPLALRRRRPGAVLFAIAGSLLVASIVVRRSSGVPVEVFLAMLLAFYSVGANCDDRRSPFVGAAGLATTTAIDLLRRDFFNGHGGPRPAAWLALAIAWLVGRDLRRRRQQLTGLRDRALLLEHEREEKARTAVVEERGRIARELHDVVAHSVSVMVVQAQAGPHLLGDAERARGVFRSIESSGREALVELRRLLGVLRTADEELAIGPQPGLDSLTSLVQQVREAGVLVELRIEGEPHQLPPGVDLSAYRIVQEALTNTIKHAHAGKVEVTVRHGPSAVELEIVDDGVGRTATANGSGHGLVGMRERVALYGGALESGSRAEGGYAVRARLPFGGGSAR